MRFARLCVILVACVPLAACASRSSHLVAGATPLERRTAALRGTAESSWNALGEAIKRGEKVDPSYVFTMGQLRQSALAIDLHVGLMTMSSGAAGKYEAGVADCEQALTKLLAQPRDQPVPITIIDFTPAK